MRVNTLISTLRLIEEIEVRENNMFRFTTTTTSMPKEFLNRDNWMQRFSTRGSDLLNELKSKGADVSRFEIYLTRQKLNLYSNYKERSSADCKFLQNALKLDYGFDELPSNMMPAAQLEAICGTILGIEKLKHNTNKIFEFKGMDVINLI